MIILILFLTVVYSELDSTIPVLDLQDYFNTRKQKTFIINVQEALHEYGFFAVKNTGVDEQIMDDLYESLKVFFLYDKSTKNQVNGKHVNNQRGYTSIGLESAKGSTLGDLKEFYSIGRSIKPLKAKQLGSWVNIWPTFMDLKNPAEKFYDHIDEYAELFQEIFSKALGKHKTFLEKLCKDGDSSCRMIHYPIKNSTMSSKCVWAKAHTDINLFTILPKSTSEGLEVFHNGSWKRVYVREDAFIINAGDFLEAFSNGYFKSSLHRVIKPKHAKKDRYASVFFVHPRSDAHIYPIKHWIKQTGGQAKYIKATRIELLMERLADLGLASNEMLHDLSESGVLERLLTVNRASPEAIKAVYDAEYASDIIKTAYQTN